MTEIEEAPFDPTPHMMTLKGKSYLPVAARVLWFRREFPISAGWGIRTHLIDGGVEKGYAVFRAEVVDPEGRVVASGTNVEDKAGFGDYLMKAETSAIGRALAACGYGTLSALDEGDVVDAPVGRPARVAAPPACSARGCGTLLEPDAAEESVAAYGAVLCHVHRPPDHMPSPAARPGPPTAPDGQPVCSDCGAPLTPGQVRVSEKAFGRRLCPTDQRKQQSNKIAAHPAV